MHLRTSEVQSVAAGLGEFDSSIEGDLITLAEALRQLPSRDRAPAWELAVRRFGHRKSLARAAGEIGMDGVRAADLLAGLSQNLAAVPPPELGALDSKV